MRSVLLRMIAAFSLTAANTTTMARSTVYMAIKADPNFRMPPEWQKMNQEVAEKVTRQEAVKEAAIEKAKNSKDKKDDS